MSISRPGQPRTARVIAFNGLLVALVLAAVASWPPSAGPVAVFAGPWAKTAAEVAAAAGGSLVAAGRYPWVVVAVSDDIHFISRLYAAGAVLVTDPHLALGCSTAQSTH